MDGVHARHTASQIGNTGRQTLYFKGGTEILLNPQGTLMTFTATLPMLEEYALALNGKIKMVDIGVMHWDPNLYDDDPTPETPGTCISRSYIYSNSGETQDAYQFRGDGCSPIQGRSITYPHVN